MGLFKKNEYRKIENMPSISQPLQSEQPLSTRNTPKLPQIGNEKVIDYESILKEMLDHLAKTLEYYIYRLKNG